MRNVSKLRRSVHAKNSRIKIIKGGKNMVYKKPEVLAQNAAQGSYAAGCPETTFKSGCLNCEVSK